MIKIIKENYLKIPIDTILHFTSFHNRVNLDKKTWQSIGVYNYQDTIGNVHVIRQEEIYPSLQGYYINGIYLNWELKIIFEGDYYWKVFTDETKTQYHKLEFENNKHTNALVLKPYKDKVHSSTNEIGNSYCQRFSSLEKAELYCYAVRNHINAHDLLKPIY